MENIRRKLRNQNTCQQIDNLFNYAQPKHIQNHHIPPHLLKKINSTARVSCNNVLQMPELMPGNDIAREVLKCQRAQ